MRRRQKKIKAKGEYYRREARAQRKAEKTKEHSQEWLCHDPQLLDWLELLARDCRSFSTFWMSPGTSTLTAL